MLSRCPIDPSKLGLYQKLRTIVAVTTIKNKRGKNFRSEYYLKSYHYAIKNQRKARNAPSRGHFVPKPLVGGFGCLELVLYGIRELA